MQPNVLEKTFSIYEVAGCVKATHMKSMTPCNICNAFKATGIFPFNRDVFTDVDFAPSEVTDRQQNQENELIPGNRTEKENYSEDNKENRTGTPSPLILPPSGSDSVSNDTSVPTCSSSINAAEPIGTPIKYSHGVSVSLSSTDASPMELPHTPPKQKIAQKGNAPHEKSPVNSSDNTHSTSTKSTAQVKNFISPFEFCGLPKACSRKGESTET